MKWHWFNGVSETCGYHYLMDEEDSTILEVSAVTIDDNPDLNLVASAPELLEALEKMHKAINYDLDTIAYSQVEDVINKARGVKSIQSFYDEENKKNSAKMSTHNLNFIKDQLINAWEVTPVDEMVQHVLINLNMDILHLSTDIDNFINQWYADDKRRNQCLMDMINTDFLLETWLTEFVPQEFIEN